MLFLASTVSRAGGQSVEETENWDRRLEMLRSVPYIALTEAEIDEADTGVVFHDPRRVSDGLNLYCSRYAGKAYLLDMKGRVVHRWDFLSHGEAGSYHHVRMLPNGDLFVIKEHSKLMLVDWDSNLLWEKRLSVHHDVAISPDGTFYTILREHKIYRDMRVWFDAIVRFTARGEELRRWSTYDHLSRLKKDLDTRSFLDSVLDSAFAGRPDRGREATEIKAAIAKDRYDFDYFHLNTITVLPKTRLGEDDGRFSEENLLVCFRNVNQVLILEKGTYRVLWSWGEGQLQWPHHPTMLENGNILIFDNGIARKYSRIIELDPVTKTIVWEYRTKFPEDFYSEARGSAQRLPNGNTLICESDLGRAFEVTPEGEIVWLWFNPATREGRRLTVYRMIRLPKEIVEPLLGRQWWQVWKSIGD